MDPVQVCPYGIPWAVTYDDDLCADVWTMPTSKPGWAHYHVVDYGSHVDLVIIRDGVTTGHRFDAVRWAVRAVSHDAGVSWF